MKKKKIISIVLSLALVISIVATAIIATANAKETDVVIDVAETELSIGQTYDCVRKGYNKLSGCNNVNPCVL